MLKLSDSKLYDQNDFYNAFLKDLTLSKKIVIIESPYITIRRIKKLLPTLDELVKRGVKVVVNTKEPIELSEPLYSQSVLGVELLQSIGAVVLFTVHQHRKLAIIDNRILWEGSLNILSQCDSCEIMHRFYSEEMTDQLLKFLNS